MDLAAALRDAGVVPVVTLSRPEQAVPVAEAVPNLTEVAEPRLVPVTTTLVPPAVGPLVGLIEVTVGAAT